MSNLRFAHASDKVLLAFGAPSHWQEIWNDMSAPGRRGLELKSTPVPSQVSGLRGTWEEIAFVALGVSGFTAIALAFG